MNQMLNLQQVEKRKKILQQQRKNAKKQAAVPPRPKPVQKPKKSRPERAIGTNAKNSVNKLDPTPWLEKYDNTVYIVGGGPSLEYFNWKLLDESRFVVGINNVYQVANVQILYFTDDDWYARHKKGLHEHSSIKIKGSLNPTKLQNDEHIYQLFLRGERGLCEQKGQAFHGRNSPYAAVNMLVQWGFKKIYLLGIDMKWGRKDPKSRHKRKTHFHNAKQHRVDSEGAYTGMAKNWQGLLPLVKSKGVSIINVNTESRLKGYPHKTYEEVFGPEWEIKK